MKHRVRQWAALAFATLAVTAAMAQAQRMEPNEDLQFIREWKHAERARTLAALLALTDQQKATLLDVKGQVDAIRAEGQQERDALQASLEATAAEGRRQLETDGALAPDTEAQLQSFRQEFRQLRREQRLRLRLAAMELEGFLTEAQREALRAGLRDRVGERAGKRHGETRRDHSRGRAMGARILLSDAFINSLD